MPEKNKAEDKKETEIVYKAPPDGWWSADRPACVATYNVLEGDEFLNQFDEAVIPFEKAPGFLLENLSAMFPGGTLADQEGRAAQLARHFLKYIKSRYSKKTEDSSFDGPTILISLRKCLLQKGATIAHLAYLIDGFMIFPGEKK